MDFRATHPLVLVLLGALVLRTVVLWALGGTLSQDPDAYRETARALVERGVYAPDTLASQAAGRPVPGAYRPPLYPLLLAAIGATRPEHAWRIGLAHLVLGLATVGLTCWLGRQLGLARWSLLAAAWVACDPILLGQSAQVMTETLAAALAAAALVMVNQALLGAFRPSPASAFLQRALWAGGAGAVAGLAALCRPAFLVWAVGLALGGALAAMAARLARLPTGTPRPRWGRLTVSYSLGLLVAITPWALRNWRSLGAPLVTTTHGGYTLYLANNPELYDYLRGPREVAWDAAAFNARWEAERQAALGAGPWPEGTERAADRAAHRLAGEAIAADLRGFLRATASRIVWFWGALPQKVAPDEGLPRRGLRLATAAFYVLELPLALMGLVLVLASKVGRSGQPGAAPPWLPALWLLASFTLVHTVYWSNLRMRAPLAPVVALLAAAGAGWIAGRNRNRCKAL